MRREDVFKICKMFLVVKDKAGKKKKEYKVS